MAGAASADGPGSTAAATAHAPPLRIGLVGCGHVSEAHLRAWRGVPGARVVALADPDPARLEQRGEAFGIEARFGSLEALLAGARLDAVDLCTPPAGREALIGRAAAAGCHVLAQKPLAPSIDEAVRCCELGERAGVVVAVKENWRWYPWYRVAGEAIRAGAIGEPRVLHLRRSCWGTPDPHWRVWREQPYLRTMPRAIWFEVGPHLVDALRALLGEPIGASAAFARVHAEMAGEDVAHVVLRFERAFATCDLSWAERGRPPRPGADRVSIDGTAGRIEIHEDGGVVRIGDDGARTPLAAAPREADADSHRAAQADFVAAIRERRAPATSARHHLHTLRIVLAAYDAVERAVAIDPPGRAPA